MSTPGEKDSERSSRQRASAECKPLLDAATKDLFRKNAFRITGLPVDATAREVAKHADKLKILVECGKDPHTQNAPFPMQPPPSLDEIREVVKNLKDPEKRLIDEFFWFWPEEFGNGQSDPAMQALAKGDSKKAVEIWAARENDEASGVIAKHNLALACHVCALDWENYSVKNEVEAERRKKITDYWKGAFNRWERLATDETFWDKVTARIRQVNEPNLPTGFARRMRATLPEALGKINAELALAFAESRKIELARLHIRFMRETHQGLDKFEKIAELVLTPARNRLKEQIQRATQSVQQNPATAHEAARILIDHARPLLDVFDLFFGAQDHFLKELFDDAATTAVNCLVAYQRKTGDNDTFVKLLEQTLLIAESVEVRRRIEENIGIGKGNLNAKKLQEDQSPLAKSSNPFGDAGGEHTQMERGSYDGMMYVVFAFIAQIIPSGILALSFITNFLKISCDDTASWIVGGLAGLGIALLIFWNRWKCIEAFSSRFCSGVANLSLLYVPIVALVYANWRGAKKVFDRREWENNGANKSSRLAIVAVAIVLVIGSASSRDANKNSSPSSPSSSVTTTPRWEYSHPVVTTAPQPQFTPRPITPSTRPTYRVPQNASAELDRDKQAIDSENAKVARLDALLEESTKAVETQKATVDELDTNLETLSRQIERNRIYLDRTSQFDIDSFNLKVNRHNSALRTRKAEVEAFNQMVDSHNTLVQQLKVQNRLVNQMVESYNAKLQRYGR